MKKIYSFFACVVFAATMFAQTATLTITNASIGGAAVMGNGAYNGGAERSWSTSGISLGGKAITSNQNNSPAGSTAGTNIQMQASAGVIYNTTALPGKILSVTINFVGTAQNSTFSGGSTGRLVNATAADYTVTGGTAVGSASSTGWATTDFTGTNYTYFAIKRGSGTSYITSIDIVYENASLAVTDVSKAKNNFIKNTLVNDEISFGTKSDVKVYNLNGQVVKQASVSENKNLDASDLKEGMYIVTGIVNGEAVSQKILKK